MGKQNEQKKKENPQIEAKKLKKKKAESLDNNQENERNGIIPDGMDFKKFIGCGG